MSAPQEGQPPDESPEGRRRALRTFTGLTLTASAMVLNPDNPSRLDKWIETLTNDAVAQIHKYTEPQGDPR